MSQTVTMLRVSGMTCSNCARHVGEVLRAISGVASVEVTLETSSVQVDWKVGTTANDSALISALKKAGYSSTINRPTDAPKSSWSLGGGWKLNVVLGLSATLPMVVAEWFFGLGADRRYLLGAFALSSVVQIVCGVRFYHGAWLQLRSGSSNMDTLVSLGSTAAYLFSVWGLVAGWHGHLYFMDAAAIITLISLGHFLEARVSARAESSLRALLKLAPDRARRLDSDGVETDVPVSLLHPGDRLVLRAGDRVPTDAEVTEGHSTVNEATLTGESLPVDKGVGAKVFGGTLNESGRLVVRVTAMGDETALAQIIKVVRRAQSSRANIQRLGDRVSNIFVPVVIMIAILTGFWWGLFPENAHAVANFFAVFLWAPHVPESALASAVFHATAVLIIACPCAMGLATPIAIMAGTNAAARRGILIRDGGALEKSGTITTILFDKTGTLTQGQLVVTDTQAAPEYPSNFPQAEVLAAALARHSNHPLSKAITAQSTTVFDFAEFQETHGSGLTGYFESENQSFRIRLGSLRWVLENQAIPDWVSTFLDKHTLRGATVLALAVDQRVTALFALVDVLKPRAAETLRELAAAGYALHLVTGDHRQTALALAEQLGIPSNFVHAEVRPAGKADLILQLQAQGQKVAFVGDGCNDAPALEQSDLGIAITRASDAAREAADILLLNSDIETIPEALRLAQATLRTIKQNLFWAFFYNAAAIPLAMFGFLSPILSAAAMGLSDLIIIGNALRLKTTTHTLKRKGALK